MRLMRVYELKGQLGVWTDNFIPTGSLVQKASYGKLLELNIFNKTFFLLRFVCFSCGGTQYCY